MESFLEEPRTIPRPTVRSYTQEIQTPSVPEVSLMFQNSREEKTSLPVNFGKNIQSYNAWKLRNDIKYKECDSFLLTGTNKENTSIDKSFFSKKQVRFENPASHYYTGKQRLLKNSPLCENTRTAFNLNENRIYSSPVSTVHPNEKTKQTEIPQAVKTFNNLVTNFTDKQRVMVNPVVSQNINTALNLNVNRTNSSPVRQAYPDFENKQTEIPQRVNTFEKIYMENLPRRELDLSFLEPQNSPCYSIRTNTFGQHNNYSHPTKNDDCNSSKFNRLAHLELNSSPKLISEAVQTQNCESINEKVTEQVNCEESNANEKQACEIKPEEAQSNETISVKDLLAIMKLQNEQIQKLQTQVEKLVKLNEEKVNEKPHTSESEKPNEIVESQSKQFRDVQVGTNDRIELNRESQKKLSVGLMTSFEVNIKPPPTKRRQKRTKCPKLGLSDTSEEMRFKPHKKIEVTRQNKANFLHYQQQRETNNRYGSPNTSFCEYTEEVRFKPHEKFEFTRQNQTNFEHYQQGREAYRTNGDERDEMNLNYRNTNETEYSLGSQEDIEIQELPESPENSIHIDMQEYDSNSSDNECSTEEGWTFYQGILGQVNHLLENSSHPNYKQSNKNQKENFVQYPDTTLEQITLATMKKLQNQGLVQSGDNEPLQMEPAEVSFAVKQILMKYLPDDGLADVVKNRDDKKKLTDVSVTAFQYRQQCNVVSNTPQYYGATKPIMKKANMKNRNSKILDVTTIKQQPKFL